MSQDKNIHSKLSNGCNGHYCENLMFIVLNVDKDNEWDTSILLEVPEFLRWMASDESIDQNELGQIHNECDWNDARTAWAYFDYWCLISKGKDKGWWSIPKDLRVKITDFQSKYQYPIL